MEQVQANIVSLDCNCTCITDETILQPIAGQSSWISQKFPIYPIVLTLHLASPYNKLCICFDCDYLPKSMTILASSDSLNYTTAHQIQHPCSEFSYCYGQGQKHRYLQFHFFESNNLCRQLRIKGIKLYMTAHLNTKFLSYLPASFVYHPVLLHLLELLQHKSLLMQKYQTRSYNQFEAKINTILQELQLQHINLSKLTVDYQRSIQKQIAIVSQQLIIKPQLQRQNYEQVQAKIESLQRQMKKYDNFAISPIVRQKLGQYWNKQIRDKYLKALSDLDKSNHEKALLEFWSEIKQIKTINIKLEQAVLMFLDYYLEFIEGQPKLLSIKILCLFLQKYSPFNCDVFFYENVLHSLFNCLNEPTVISCIYTLFQKLSHYLFLNEIINGVHQTRLFRLQILHKLTQQHIQILDYQPIINFIINLLLEQQLKLSDKNKAYNIVAYLCTIYNQQQILDQFHKINVMSYLNLEKAVKNKHITLKNQKSLQNQESMCQYCGKANLSYQSEQNLKIHYQNECKYFVECQHCQQIIQIPQLYKHWINNCRQKHLFKQCDYCTQTYLKVKQTLHMKNCPKTLISKCPLCDDRMDNKLKLKQHILKGQCPNNNIK